MEIIAALCVLRFCGAVEASAALCKLLFSFDVFDAGRATASTFALRDGGAAEASAPPHNITTN